MPRDAKEIEKGLPSTLDRSPEKAKRTYAETKASAERQYGEGERAERTAWSQVKDELAKATARKQDRSNRSNRRGG